MSIPIGTIQWQQTYDGINWADFTNGTSSASTSSESSATISFSYMGASQNFTIPRGVNTIQAEGIGAAGGHGSSDFNGRGGLGGRLISNLTVIPGEIISIFVGGIGGNTTGNPGTGQQANNLWVAGNALGGFNGGGNATSGGGGGGGTDIRRGGSALNDRIFVVGSGGGGNQRRGAESGGNGGNGGGVTAGNGIAGAGGGAGGTSGTNSTGGVGGLTGGTNGALGQGGNGATSSRNGGGGGYYGRGGGGWRSH